MSVHEPSDGIPEELERQLQLVILTAHPEVDYEMVVRVAPLVFDTRGVTTQMNASNVVRL